MTCHFVTQVKKKLKIRRTEIEKRGEPGSIQRPPEIRLSCFRFSLLCHMVRKVVFSVKNFFF
ncbi:MAG TPA: hypothetical protein DE060_10535 [Lentisphaeria bacterium]|nr:hypothetical protein [Lentisphaeria bacterium]HCG49622.1 hypothetical protein [Lentisphaeria bacterium]